MGCPTPPHGLEETAVLPRTLESRVQSQARRPAIVTGVSVIFRLWQCQDNASNQATVTSFYILSVPRFTHCSLYHLELYDPSYWNFFTRARNGTELQRKSCLLILHSCSSSSPSYSASSSPPIEVLLLWKLPNKEREVSFRVKKNEVYHWERNFDRSTTLKATQSMNQKDSKEMAPLCVNLTSLVDIEGRNSIVLWYFLRRTRSHETAFSIWRREKKFCPFFQSPCTYNRPI